MRDENNFTIQEALNVLGVASDSTKEQILNQTQKLKAKYQTLDSFENHQKVSEIESAKKILLLHLNSTTLNNSSKAHSDPKKQNDTVDFKSFMAQKTPPNRKKQSNSNASSMMDTDSSQNQKYFKYFKKKNTVIFLCSLAVFAIIIAIPFTVNYYRESRYTAIESMMMDFNTFNMYLIEDYINDLPDDYENIKIYKEDYNIIMDDVKIIENGDIGTDYKNMREAYFNLIHYNNNSPYDLSSYIDNVDGRIPLYNIEFSNGSKYFWLQPDPEEPSRSLLCTGLPNNQKSYVDYFYTSAENYRVFGYKNQYNHHDQFDAYRILYVDKHELEIYSYKSQKVYLLYP